MEPEGRKTEKRINNCVDELLIGPVEIVSCQSGTLGRARSINVFRIGKRSDLDVILNEDIIVEDEVTRQDIAVNNESDEGEENKDRAISG